MKIKLYKYQGAGNDFVILDNRSAKYNLTSNQIRLLCDRRFGIGGDGFMTLNHADNYDFSMRYYNSDGLEGTMCGNGGRCLVAFADYCGIKSYNFIAIDGEHRAEILSRSGLRDIVKLKMIDVAGFHRYSPTAYFLNTGSPHYVEFINIEESSLKDYPVDERGKFWRYHKDFEGGTNANFVDLTASKEEYENVGKDLIIRVSDAIEIRTYERGVEAETYACGTGITASALSAFMHYNRERILEYIANREQSADQKADNSGKTAEENRSQQAVKTYIHCDVKAVGDNLSVDSEWDEQNFRFSNIWLTGPATQVFSTEIEI